jgi:hypothetical protein
MNCRQIGRGGFITPSTSAAAVRLVLEIGGNNPPLGRAAERKREREREREKEREREREKEREKERERER